MDSTYTQRSITHPLKRIHLNHTTFPIQAINAGEGVEKREPSTLLVGMQTSTATMENSVEIP